MAKILFPKIWQLHKVSISSIYTKTQGSICLTQQEVATALRPLYFAVHPDLFYQYPKEKAINENSLKQLNFYLETVLKDSPSKPTSLIFCLKAEPGTAKNGISFKQVKIQLFGKDVYRVLHNILASCHLPTEYLDSLLKSKSQVKAPDYKYTNPYKESHRSDQFHSSWWNEAQKLAQEIEQRIRNEPDIDFREWLNKNIDKAFQKLQASQPLRDEIERLSSELKESLQLKDMIWNCGWGITHFRGCLQSFKGLTLQHPSDMAILNGRTVVFGHQTGVSFEGHIILSSQDVRNNWLDMICSIDQHGELLTQIPETERSLSEVLRGITVGHRKFQPTRMVQKYVQQLGKLTSALYKYRWKNGYPAEWPRRLSDYQIVVECEAGPLMLSPTGQFIVPASLPAFVLVDFITTNMEEASKRLQIYSTMKAEETKVHMECLSKLGLSSLEKDDNITPDLMVECCKRILKYSTHLSASLLGLRLRISHYYSILQDGEMCIPWNWKSSSWEQK